LHASIEVSHFELFDIQHVSHKFPTTPQYLVDRCGKANTKRRQLLRYHETHHDKIAGRYEPDVVQTDLRPTKGEEASDTRQVVTAVSENPCDENCEPLRKSPRTIVTTTNTQTVVTTFVPRNFETADAHSEADQSQNSIATSFASSTAAGDGVKSHLNIPPPPDQENALDGNPFQCPLCFTIIKVKSQTSWM
jgi:hypothetical protein